MAYLDISIKSADKYLTEKRIKDFLETPIEIEQKTDGVKLSVHKVKSNGNINDYVFSYKGNILYQNEYKYQSVQNIKTECIGASQFRMVFEHFEQISKLKENSIPVGTELFIEFLMRKPTLSSNYLIHHKMVLIGYSKSDFKIKYGKLLNTPGEFQTTNRELYANELGIDTPELLFKGVLKSKDSEHSFEHSFIQGIKNNKLRLLYKELNKTNLDVTDFKKLFLSVPSVYGGTEEGVILKRVNSPLLKWQQDYQLDQTARFKIKQKYREDEQASETKYWEYVKEVASALVHDIDNKFLEIGLSELSSKLENVNIIFNHSKKKVSMIKDDIQLNAKMLLVKRLNGNNNALIIGKFRVTTEGHVRLIERAIQQYDNVCICVVTSKDTKETKDVRTEMIRAQFPGVEVIHAQNGNLIRIMQKSPMNINAVLAGSDRVQGYKEQLKNTVGVQVNEYTRTDSDISASKVLENILDEQYFKKFTPVAIHDFYGKLKMITGNTHATTATQDGPGVHQQSRKNISI